MHVLEDVEGDHGVHEPARVLLPPDGQVPGGDPCAQLASGLCRPSAGLSAVGVVAVGLESRHELSGAPAEFEDRSVGDVQLQPCRAQLGLLQPLRAHGEALTAVLPRPDVGALDVTRRSRKRCSEAALRAERDLVLLLPWPGDERDSTRGALRAARGGARGKVPLVPERRIREAEADLVAKAALGVVEDVHVEQRHGLAGLAGLEAEVDVVGVEARERGRVEAKVPDSPGRQDQEQPVDGLDLAGQALEVDGPAALVAAAGATALPPLEAGNLTCTDHAEHGSGFVLECHPHFLLERRIANLEVLVQEDERLEVLDPREGVEDLVVGLQDGEVVGARGDRAVRRGMTAEPEGRVLLVLLLRTDADAVGDHCAPRVDGGRRQPIGGRRPSMSADRRSAAAVEVQRTGFLRSRGRQPAVQPELTGDAAACRLQLTDQLVQIP